MASVLLLFVQKYINIKPLQVAHAFFPKPAFLLSTPGSGVKRGLVRGFTLIELLVVMVIITVVLGVLLPRFGSVTTQNLKSDSSRVASLVRYLYEAAESKKLFYRIIFDIDNSKLSIEKSKDSLKYVKESEGRLSGISLSNGVEILDISAPGIGKKDEGIVEILLTPYGGSTPFTLHLSTGESTITLLFNPYTGRVTVEEGYS